ncbi:MAG: alpha/beta hydrolase [Hyphomicrobiaceae bacterium]|nr:alpha/beta hydrolase [Hyphomicrobiaceae bacterium]
MTSRIRHLCPGMRRFITQTERFYVEAGCGETASLAQQRVAYERFARGFRRPRPAGVSAEDVTLATAAGKLRTRLYRGVTGAAGPRPGFVFLHGGGFALGSLDSHDCIAAEIAEAAQCVVVSVAYRLAPEAPFPAAHEDAVAGLSHVIDEGEALGIDGRRVAIGGDSAGAALALSAALARRDAGLPGAIGQLLIYPVLTTAADLPSYVENADAPMLTAESLAYFWSLYTHGPRFARDPRAAPLLADSFRGLGSTLIATASHDPARDDGASLWQRLRADGVPVQYRCATDLAHGYLRARAMSPSAAIEFVAACAWLRQTLHAASTAERPTVLPS